MKNKLALLAIMIFFQFNLFSQETEKVWINENGKYRYYGENGCKSELFDAYYNGSNDKFEEVFIVRNNGKYAFIKPDCSVITEWYDAVDRINTGKAYVRKNKKCSYVNPEGKIITDWFDWVSERFNNGFAQVQKGDKYAYINNAGKVVSAWYDGVRGFNKGISVVRNGKKLCLLNKSCKEITGWYDEINSVYDRQFSYFPLVCKEMKYGYIDSTGKAITNIEFDKAYLLKNDSARVEKDGKYTFINSKGKLITDWKTLPKEGSRINKLSNPTFANTPGTSEYNILNFGAIGDSKTINTKAIQAAIDACSETGGTVVFPAGRFMTGTIILKSNVFIELQINAVLLGSNHLEDYPRQKSILSKEQGFLFLIYGSNIENTGITGQGTIDGNGLDDAWLEIRSKWEGERPYGIGIFFSKNIVVKDITLLNSICWMQHYGVCENIMISGIRVFNHDNSNNDGIDIDDCRNVVMSDCIIDSDDDAICLKSEGYGICENITINNCIASSNCNPIKFGTRSVKGFRNITITNCIIKPCEGKRDVVGGYKGGLGAFSIECVDGGLVENINISNCSVEGVLTPIFIRLANRSNNVGILRNVNISNITATNASRLSNSITAIPGYYVENVQLSNINIIADGKGTIADVNRQIPEAEKSYPETTKFGESLPSYGFYVRHAKNISFNNVTFSYKGKDERPAIVINDVKGTNISGMSALPPSSDEALIKLIKSSDVVISNVRPLGQVNAFVKIADKESDNIKVFNNDLSKVKNEIVK